MRMPPPLELELPPQRVWAVALHMLQLAVLLALVPWAWQWQPHAQALPQSVGLVATVAVLCLLQHGAGGGAALAWSLRFDGLRWHWLQIAAPVGRLDRTASGRPPSGGSGGLQIAASLGPWILLRARPDPGCGAGAWLLARPIELGLKGQRLRAVLAWP